MPLNKKGKKIMKNMKKEYGSKQGENVFYASKNKGTIKGVELKDEDFQQHEEVRGANSNAMKWLKARMDKAADRKDEGVEKQKRIALDKEKTAVGASASNQADDPRRSPSLSTDHNSPEGKKRRKHSVVIRRSDRSNKKHADDVARGREEKRQRDQAAIDKANKAEKKRKDEITMPKQTKPSKGMKSTYLTRKLKSGEYNRAGKGGGPRISRVGIKQKETDDKREHGSIRDHKFLAYKDLAYRMDEILGALATGAVAAVGGMAAKKVLGKSEKKKAEEKRKAELAAKQNITDVDESLAKKLIQKADKTKLGRKVLGGTKEVARVAGMVPGVGAAGDAAALGIAGTQRSGEKDPERRKELGKEMAGDAAALVPGAGLGTRGAQYAAKAGKAVRGTKAARKGSKLGKLRGRAGAAVRKHGATAAKAGEAAIAQKLKDKSMEDETQMNNAYVNKLVETRSPESRARTRGRKFHGTQGRQGEAQKRQKAGQSISAHGHGQRAAKDIASAKVYRKAASDIESHSKKNPGPDPKRRKDVTATATTALRDTASRKEQSGRNQIKAGKQAAGNKRALNRTLKRDETKGNLAKLSIRSHTEYRNIGKLFVEMCQACKDDGTEAAKAEKDPRKKQGAYNKARREAEHKRHGTKGETSRQTQTRRHGQGGVPSAKLKRSEQRALADREEPK